MTRPRAACATIVLGATLVGAGWLATYHIHILVADHPRSYRLPYPITFYDVYWPAWWGAYAAMSLLILGAGIALRALGKRLRPAQRTSELLLVRVPGLVRPRLPVRPFSRKVLGGLDWLVVEPLRLLVKR